MPDGERSAGPRPETLIESLEQIDLRKLDIDQLGRAIDPRKLGKEEFAQVLAAIDELADRGADVDLSKMDANTFARIISRASSGQISGVMARPKLRSRVLDEIFRRMSAHFRSDRGKDTRAVVHWRLTGGAGPDGYDRYETIIEDGTCTVRANRTRDPRVTITVHPVELVKLITRNASAPVLFMTGKLKVKGDLAFAAGMINLFDLPRG